MHGEQITATQRTVPSGLYARLQRRPCGTPCRRRCHAPVPPPPYPSDTPASLLYSLLTPDPSLNRRYVPRFSSKASEGQQAPPPSASRSTMAARAGTTSWCLPTARSAWLRAWRSYERASLPRSHRAGPCLCTLAVMNTGKARVPDATSVLGGVECAGCCPGQQAGQSDMLIVLKQLAE